MPHKLLFNGSNNYASFPNAINGNIGADAWTFEIEASFQSVNANGSCILGGALTSANDGFFINSAGRLNVLTSSTARITGNVGFIIFDSTIRVYRIEHDAGGAFRYYRDGVLIQSGTYTGSYTFNGGLGVIGKYRPNVEWYIGMNLVRITVTGFTNSAEWKADLSGGSGLKLPTTAANNDATQSGSGWPADDSEWVFYGSGGSQLVTVPAASQQDVAATVAISATQTLAVAAAKQQDIATVISVGSAQVLAVPSVKQKDIAAPVSVVQSAPGAQPITVPAAKQQDAAAAIAIGANQFIAVTSAEQQDSASTILVGQPQTITLAASKQQDKALSISLTATQVLTVPSVAQTDWSARVSVGTSQIIVVPPVKQVDKSASVATVQLAPVTRPIDPRTLCIELTTPRHKVVRTTKTFTAQLTTPRYSIARA